MNCRRPATQGPPVRGKWRRRRRLLAGAVLWLATCSGCASLSQKSPVAENVISSRQMSIRGLDAMHCGKWDEAEKLFATAVQTCPADERAHQHYAQTLWHRGAYRDAIEHMHTAVRLSGDDPQLLVETGKMHLAAGELPLAARYANAAIAGNRSLATGWALKGEVESRSGTTDEALASFHRALSLDESLPGVPQAVGEMYLRQGNPGRALATAQAAAAKYPDSQIPRDLLRIEGLAYKSLGCYEDAVAKLSVACEQDESDHELLYQLGHARLLAGDPSNARLALNQALKLNPTHAESLELRASIDRAAARMASSQR